MLRSHEQKVVGLIPDCDKMNKNGSFAKYWALFMKSNHCSLQNHLKSGSEVRVYLNVGLIHNSLGVQLIMIMRIQLNFDEN